MASNDEVRCEHGVAMDVHCCGCHSGFLFDIMTCTCLGDPLVPQSALRVPFTYVPDKFRANAFVAGGFAVDAERASDIDIWILNCDKELMVKGFYDTAFLTYLNTEDKSRAPWSFSTPADPYEIGGVKRLGTLYHPLMQEKDTRIQILVSDLLDVWELLKSFDLSVHQVAYDVHANTYRVPTTTPLGITPVRVTRFDTPHSTLRRYFKLTERYESAIEWTDIETLCSLAISIPFKGRWPGKKADQ